MDSVFERALFEIGANGNFQKRFDILYNLVFAALWPCAYNNIILALVITPHFCTVPENLNNISEHVWKLKYIPMIEDTSGKNVYSSCIIYVNPEENNVTKDCDSYTYDKTWYESTISTNNNWVCNNEINVANVFGYSKIGEVFGAVIFGWIGDKYGRRIAYTISLAFLVMGRLMSIIGSDYFSLLVLGCILASSPSWTAVQSVTSISMEISSPDRRTVTATYRSVAYSIGMAIMPLLYWWLRDWKPFMIVTTLTQLPFLIFSWKVVESPRWLWTEGKTAACGKVLKQISRVNNSKLEEDTEHELLTVPPPSKQKLLGPLSLFSGWKLSMNTILQLYLWVAVTISYVVLIMGSGEKSDSNPFLEFAWQSLAEIPGTFIGAWMSDNLGRRYAGALSYLVSTSMFALSVIRDSGSDTWFQSWWVGSAFVIINRTAITVAFYLIYLLNMELYPTCLRQSGMSFGSLFSSIGAAIAPYLMYAGHQFDARIPAVILTVTSLFGLFASLLLPETLNAKLPETLTDAKNFGKRKQNYVSVELKDENQRNSMVNENC